MGKTANHLLGQTSPYLLQHLHNPVEWHPWGENALSKAKQEDKPLLVSVGYSSCHWCHVMEKESFMDEDVARIMNEHFVCIKVDREERPDIDHLYMDAVQLISGHGGWPLNCFALPDGRPFWGATYFPKDQWTDILHRINTLYRNQREDILKQAESITQGIVGASLIAPAGGQASFSRSETDTFFNSLMQEMDGFEGGTKGAPKFPMPVSVLSLLHYHRQTHNRNSVNQASLTLKKMAMGGIFDQIGGGFARYATDTQWRIPHFEKMLYDNAQLVSLYAKAYMATRDPLFRDVFTQTIDFVNRELRSRDGLFYSALDADTEGEEGKYYVWTAKEIDEVTGAASPLIKKYYHIGEKGFWEKGKNVLLREHDAASFARAEGINEELFEGILTEANSKLLKMRETRTHPGLDNKILTSWNAMMIEGLVDAFAATTHQGYLSQASAAMRKLIDRATTDDGGLRRTINNEEAVINGFLEDYAMLIKALIRLYELSTDTDLIDRARQLTEYVIEHFSSPGTNLFLFSPKYDMPLAAPHFEVIDNVIPSSNGVMAHNLFRLANLLEHPEWGNRSSSMLRDMRSRWERYSVSFANWGSLLLHHTAPFHTVVVVGADAKNIIHELGRYYLPDVILSGTTTPKNNLPLFKGRFKPGETWIYICSFGYCKQPVSTVKEALSQLYK